MAAEGLKTEKLAKVALSGHGILIAQLNQFVRIAKFKHQVTGQPPGRIAISQTVQQCSDGPGHAFMVAASDIEYIFRRMNSQYLNRAQAGGARLRGIQYCQNVVGPLYAFNIRIEVVDE